MLVRQSSTKRTTKGAKATQKKHGKFPDPSASSALSAVSLIADHRYDNLPPMRDEAVFEEEDTLPSS
jgi:hypothetical protein